MYNIVYTVLVAATDQADVAEVAADVPVTEPAGWVTILLAVLGTIVVPYITNYLKKASDAKKVELEVSGLDKKEKIKISLQAFAFERAEAYVEKDFLVLAKMIAMGEIKDMDKVKDYLKGLGSRLRDDLIVYAKEQFDVDIIADYGSKVVDGWIESVANRVSPFPGKDTAEALLKGGAQKLIDNGVKRVQSMVLSGEDKDSLVA